MCPMTSAMGPFIALPATMLLVISFFILVAARKLDTQALKAFGVTLAVILWACSAMLISRGVYEIVTGKYAMQKMCQKKMMYKMMGKCQKMMEKCEMKDGRTDHPAK